MQFLGTLALVLASASAGVVVHERCGGVGTFIQLRISGCVGPVCAMQPGTSYSGEGDLIPAASTNALRLKIQVHFNITPVTIVDTVLPNSGTCCGWMYTAKFNITPNDILEGRVLPITAEISESDTELLHACIRFLVSVGDVTSTTTTQRPPYLCPESGILRVPHEERCDASYICINGKKWDQPVHCPEGLYFDQRVGECNYSEEVDCGDLLTPTESSNVTS